MIVPLSKPAEKEDIEKASQDYKKYIKVTIDIKQEKVIIGGEYHFDAEQVLLREGSLQKDIWGGGLDLELGIIEGNALINMRPAYNPGSEILNGETREKFTEIATKYLKKYVQ